MHIIELNESDLLTKLEAMTDTQKYTIGLTSIHVDEATSEIIIKSDTSGNGFLVETL